ncbi:MAG: ribonuclease Y [Thermoanaerobaculia bacterium]|nr:ribonuclease Y [Thermoanaerobaculia bacterium]MBP9823006.1 ribonuclease Y [Thermoanaerobaculia bacterium]
MISALWIAVAAVVVSAAVLVYGWSRIRHVGEKRLAEAEREAARMREEARRDSEAKLKEGELAAKEKLLQARTEFETASRARRGELETLERRLTQKEDSLDKRMGELDQRDKELVGRDRTLTGREREVAGKEVEADRLVAEQRNRLEQIAGLTAQQAKDELTRGLENEARIDAAHLVKRIEDEAREQGNRKAQWLMGLAVQRLASDYISETTVSVVELPSDEMKGRIIGREGRNIRALELATGIDLIVDDTPEAVILSGFDPYRREIARVALERLIADGRIHPARIEEVVEKVKAEFEQRIQQEGDAALLELKIPGMHPELVKLMGRLRYRYSYGQNVLQHSKEVAFLAATMAAELKVNVTIAKRAGLLHDIGKAIDREVDGTHVQLGIELLRKYGESEEVVHAMACHHGDFDPQTVEAVLVTASDALSAARPGARREVLETYVKRLEKLEEIANSFKGVQKSFAIQAGREVRIIVDSGKIGDEQAIWLSKDIAKRIEAELTYPGEIRVTVIRETRAVEFAR